MPPEHEGRSRAFYDHEQDDQRGRRRRAVADWGVSEDVFDRMPGPRFSRRGETLRHEETPRARFVREEKPRVDDESDVDAWLDEAVYEDEPTSRTIVIEREPGIDAEIKAEPLAETAPGADAPYADARHAGAPYADARYADSPYADAPYADAPYADAPYADVPDDYAPRGHVAPNGRRTIVIGGHPDRLPVQRTRPPRTAVERIGPRPDRIVGYAVAMGVLLILIAILTSS
jgi:hypothetical protein